MKSCVSPLQQRRAAQGTAGQTHLKYKPAISDTPCCLSEILGIQWLRTKEMLGSNKTEVVVCDMTAVAQTQLLYKEPHIIMPEEW